MAKKSIADQVRDLENTRAAKAARMKELADKAMDRGESMNAEEVEEFDGLDSEMKQLDGDLVRMRRLAEIDQQSAAAAVAVDGSSSEAADLSRRGFTTIGERGPAIIVASRDAAEKFKGQNFTRKVIAKAAAHLLDTTPYAIAKHRWGQTNPTLCAIIKANEVAGGGADSGEWGAELAISDGRYTGDFIEFLYAATVFDKLPLRQVPANVFIKGQDGTATGYWVGESKAIPASKADFSAVELRRLKVGALAVISNDLIRESSPDAEMLVRDSLVNASAQRVDQTFLSTTALSAGVSPAGILYNVSAGSSAGTDDAGLRKDVENLYRPFINAYNANDLWFVMNVALAKSIQLLVTSLGIPAFPTINANGGTLLGDNVVTGNNLNGNWLILLKPSDIYRIGDLGVEVSISRDAMIEQSSAPTGATDTPVAASQVFTSMFQEESTAIKVVRPINFAKRRTSAVAYIGDADYGAADSP